MNDEEKLVTQRFVALEESIDRLCKVLSTWANEVCKALAPILESVQKCLQIVHCEWKSAYAEAGTPYGDSDEGMYFWLGALSKAHALRMEADEIESHLEWLAEWRRK